ncbi:MAG: tetratricopeptide repeat protein [Pyrinomonadaceae bacterium]
MNFKSFLSFLFMILLGVTVVLAQDETRVSATWQVQKYDISATVPQSESDRNLAITAKVEARNASARPASTMTLRLSTAADISAVAVNGTSSEFSKREEKTATGSLQQIVVRMPSVAPSGSVSVEVTYRLAVKENSGLAAISSTGSQFLPLSYWYPTPNSWFFARGADYAPARVQVTAPSGFTVVSSGAESGGVFDGKLNVQPFFAAGSWDTVGANGVFAYLPKGADPDAHKRGEDLMSIAGEAKSFVAGLLGTASTTGPMRLVSVRRGAGFSGGGTIFFDEAVLRRPKVDSQTALYVAEGVAKMWLGGSTAVSGDGSGAVREGLARFLATQFIENKYGKDIADVERLRQRVTYASVVQRDSPITTVSPLDDYYYTVVANKGAMVWRLLFLKVGSNEFSSRIKATLDDRVVTLGEVRAAFTEHKAFLDYGFDQTTDMNLLAGLPQQGAGEAKVALRNTGAIDVTVDVEALLENGQRMLAPASIRATSFGDVIFKTPAKIRRIEIDRQKLYPQTDFSDDVAPRELTDSDPLLAVKRSFDKQDFAAAEKTARQVLADFPRHDDVRILLGRSLLGLNRNMDAEKEFRAVLEEKLPTSRSIGWALVGLADVAARSNQNEQAAKLAATAIRSEGEYGASLAARNIRNRAGVSANSDASITGFFEQWDRAAAANQKAQLDALVLPGEASRFSGGVAGQTAAWKTQIKYVDMIDANTALVEANLAIKLLNRDPESGLAVFRVARSGAGWKILSVDVFELR